MEARRFRKHVGEKIYGKQTYGMASLMGYSKVHPATNDEILEHFLISLLAHAMASFLARKSPGKATMKSHLCEKDTFLFKWHR